MANMMESPSMTEGVEMNYVYVYDQNELSHWKNLAMVWPGKGGVSFKLFFPKTPHMEVQQHNDQSLVTRLMK